MKLKYDYNNETTTTNNYNTTYIDIQKTLKNTINKNSEEYKSGQMGGSNISSLISGGSWNKNEK